MKVDTNIYFKQITFFENKKRFWKNHTYFFLKNIYFFQLSFATFEQQGRRKLFYGGGLSKNVGHYGWPTTKNEKKKKLAKAPQGSPPKNEIWTKI